MKYKGGKERQEQQEKITSQIYNALSSMPVFQIKDVEWTHFFAI